MNTELLFLGSMAFMTCVMWFWILAHTMREYARREDVYLKIIRSLENRLSAKDLAGYMALESEDRRAQAPTVAFSRDDEAEARIAAMKAGEG